MIRLLATLALLLAASPAWALDTLVYLNAQRAYLGLYPLRPDPQLQQAAESACQQRAMRGMHGHLMHRPVAGRWEGTASRSARQRGPAGELWGPEDIYACYQNHRSARYAGASSVFNPRTQKWYYQINLR